MRMNGWAAEGLWSLGSMQRVSLGLAQQVMCLLCFHEDLSSDLPQPYKKQGLVGHMLVIPKSWGRGMEAIKASELPGQSSVESV